MGFYRKGFTLVELMVSVSIMMLLIGVGVVSINQFNSRQKLDTTRQELISALKLARNYAVTMQLPPGYSENTLKYVFVDLYSNGKLSVVAQDVGATFFTRDISPVGVTISTVPNDIRFNVYTGKLMVDDDVVIYISSSEGIGDTRIIEIKSSGLINEK